MTSNMQFTQSTVKIAKINLPWKFPGIVSRNVGGMVTQSKSIIKTSLQTKYISIYILLGLTSLCTFSLMVLHFVIRFTMWLLYLTPDWLFLGKNQVYKRDPVIPPHDILHHGDALWWYYGDRWGALSSPLVNRENFDSI